MKSLADVVSGAGLSGYAEVALLIFFVVFVLLGLRVLLSRDRAYTDAARLPLEDDTASSTTRGPNVER